MRAGELTFDPSADSKPSHPQNVGNTERAVSALAGGFVALRGLRRGGLSGVLVALAGAALVKRGVSGYCPVKARMELTSNGRRGAARPSDYFNHGVHVEEAVTIQAPASQVYAFWRDFENLARFMKHVKDVQVIDHKRSHWSVEGPAGKTVEWDAEIINEEEGRLISWRSLPGAEVDNTGTVQFREAPHGRGTEVRVVLEYLPPAGKLGLAIAKVFGKTPGAEVRDDLRRLRQIIETGEVPTTEGQPRGEGKRGRIQTAMVAEATRLATHADHSHKTRYAREEDRSQNKYDRSGTQRPSQEPVGHAGDSSEEGGGE